ncbi:ADP-ribose pyrophosphatase [Mycobacteroides abscessus]|uniref:ADP-ribose pyrophosphatase n=6 Tax=Mycobacteroides abscessus TaxID=36809 RepID=A0AB74FAF2_9MYCO|nr:NUDIX domain-containing protein [Mycobacteroides abscessus]EUA69296.1 NUDIX domain protein [Mycobacteroides abscessus subsp. bolletii 1513]AMU26565.1 DNA mismatch repair protein MutT [Mycobacteroides abscessus]AMU36246.1 DNA mismatch repair protein MutT [Mycobacteroides abscessus]AMU41293.1 DNA mismatch repair protein MutT [Mycobacteroides abscessus]AMU61269.1 DNA mismatch repair protein MutT [Mycobacteroides abscessus]
MRSMTESNLAVRAGDHPVHGTWLSVDVVALTDDPEPKIVLIERAGAPHKGEITLPGGLLAAWEGETVEQCAQRIVRDKAGTEVTGGIAVVDVVSDPDRDERGHTVSIVVVARVPAEVRGAVPVTQMPEAMPFGHTAIARSAILRLGERLLVDPDTTRAMLGDETTLAQVRALLGVCGPTTAGAARKRLDRSPLYRRTEELRKPAPTGRPGHVYRFLV